MYRSDKRTLKIAPSLPGKHQLDNAASAIACIDQMTEFVVSDEHVIAGLAAAKWPARLQRIENRHFLDMLPAGSELWLDGGHNPQGAKVLAEWLEEKNAQEVYFISGMIKGKDMTQFFGPLKKFASAVYGVAITDEPQGQPAAAVAKAAASLGMDAQEAASVQNALQSIAARAKTAPFVCICGSLYLAGKVLAEIEKYPD
ncbi:MAG: hypothetical protein EBR02_10300 [Alphaproteobacteria bacterium]|nr:hypothetical protein [Alphaproteobacteria bacterium]